MFQLQFTVAHQICKSNKTLMLEFKSDCTNPIYTGKDKLLNSKQQYWNTFFQMSPQITPFFARSSNDFSWNA